MSSSNKRKQIPYPEFEKLIAARIKNLRKSGGFKNYEDFTNEKNINRVQYGRYERGADFRMSSLVKLLNAFDISVAEFFSEGFGN